MGAGHRELETTPARLISIGTANPPEKYTQAELIELFGVEDRKLRRLFSSSHIATRHLTLPSRPPGASRLVEETPVELHAKHRAQALAQGSEAIQSALAKARIGPSDVDYLACVTTTGFLCPSLTAHFIKSLGFRPDVHRLDVVGMGCNGGLNAMQPVTRFCSGQPGRVGLLVCVEVCSAAYVFDETMRTAVVNSLFGDGAAAAVFVSGVPYEKGLGPKVLGYASHIIIEAFDAMRFDFDGHKNSFFISKDIPYHLGGNAAKPVTALLRRFGLKRRDVGHWVVHSGGRKVIDAIKYALDLTSHDVRHTQAVLTHFGNLSSASFLFSHQRLLDEGVVRPGERVLMMTMGPGSTIETCLGEF